MTHDEANVYISILHKHYNNVELTFPETRSTYRKLLLRYDNNLFAEIIDDLLLTHKYCPKPPEIIENYNRKFGEVIHSDKRDFAKAEGIRCWVCMDKGYFFVRVPDQDQGHDYYCDKCQNGNNWKYDGNSLEKKSPYLVEPVSKHYNTQTLIQKNQEVNPQSGREFFFQECKRLRMNVNAILNPKGREEACPF